MFFESLLVKIATAIFKKAMLSSVIKTVATAFEIYSIVDAISDINDVVETSNSCSELNVAGIEVISNKLTEVAYDKIMNIGNHAFTVEKTASGIYVASRLAPTFKTTQLILPTVNIKNQPSIYTSVNPTIRTKNNPKLKF